MGKDQDKVEKRKKNKGEASHTVDMYGTITLYPINVDLKSNYIKQ